MKNKTRKILFGSAVAIGGAIVSTAAIAIGGSNYLIDYALKRPKKSGDDKKAPRHEKGEVEKANYDFHRERVALWKTETKLRNVKIESHDGLQLSGHIYFAEGSDLWVVVVHGYKSDSTSVEDVACEYSEKGYNVLLPDLRSHGESEGKYIGMGYQDQYDILEWISYIVERNPHASIVLHGQSMGGATVIMTAALPDLPENVVAVVEDSGFSDGFQMMKEQMRYRFHLPTFLILDTVSTFGKYRIQYDLRAACPLKALEAITVPILFIHGTKDEYVLPYMHEELYEAYKGEKESLLIEGAGHVASRNIEPELYYTTVFEFIERHT
ncbi:MAG: alpha/beta hydrolase [Bacillota bacterium]